MAAKLDCYNYPHNNTAVNRSFEGTFLEARPSLQPQQMITSDLKPSHNLNLSHPKIIWGSYEMNYILFAPQAWLNSPEKNIVSVDNYFIKPPALLKVRYNQVWYKSHRTRTSKLQDTMLFLLFRYKTFYLCLCLPIFAEFEPHSKILQNIGFVSMRVRVF